MNFHFYPLKVVARCRDPQLQVGKITGTNLIKTYTNLANLSMLCPSNTLIRWGNKKAEDEVITT